MLNNIFTIALAIHRNVTFPESMNDMQITEEQYNDLNGIFDYDEDLNSFRLKDDWFVWPKGIIPYQFDEVRAFHQVDKNRVIAAMEKINLNLPNCILFRYNNLYIICKIQWIADPKIIGSKSRSRSLLKNWI